MDTISLDVSALQDLPQEEQIAIDDLAGSALGQCTWTCWITCSYTSLTTAAAAEPSAS